MKELFILLAAMAVGAPLSIRAQERPDLIPSAKVVVSQMASGDFDGAISTFDATMKALSPPDKLKQAWELLALQYGPFKAQTGARQQRAPRYDVVFVTCQFENGSIDIKLVYTDAKEITGMFFLPAGNTPEYVYKTPDYARPASFTEKEVQVGSGEWVLPGTLTLPVGPGPFPAAVLVHGSGPEDRNESAGPNRPFQDIAWGLASRGIAVLRYDKRNKVYPQKVVPLIATFTVKEETIDDALAAVALLRQTPGIDPNRVFVLGHSLGGRMAPRIAAQDSRIAGLVILAGSTKTLEQSFVDQLNYLISLGGPEGEADKAVLAQVTAQLEELKDPNLPDSAVIIGASPVYWRDMNAYNPGQVAASLKVPILLLQGERDYQVTLEDLAGWKKYLAGRGNAQFKTYPKLNHLFQEGEGKPAPREYMVPGHVPEYVIEDVAAWIKSQRSEPTHNGTSR
ncbi:MAG TPA: alpha/beta fold hydrolase [Blastocatellia bacterium]